MTMLAGEVDAEPSADESNDVDDDDVDDDDDEATQPA